MVLNRNPESYFAEVEQSAFSPANFVLGIGPSPDKMLQGRLFSYHDTHRHRLGPNYHLLPVNASKASNTNNYQRDGFMNFGTSNTAVPRHTEIDDHLTRKICALSFYPQRAKRK